MVVPGRSLGVRSLLEHTVLDEPLEALREDLAGDPEIALDVIEAGYANPDVSEEL